MTERRRQPGGSAPRRDGRRSSDRLAGLPAHEAPQALPEESWFGALGVDLDLDRAGRGGDTPPAWPETAGVAADTRSVGLTGDASGAEAGGDRGAERHGHGRDAAGASRAEALQAGTARRRILRTYLAARALLGLLLVGAVAVLTWLGQVHGAGWWGALLCAGYALQSAAVWYLPGLLRLRPTTVDGDDRVARTAWWLTVGVDLVVFYVLHLLDLGLNLNFAALLVLPVLMAGVLMPRVSAMAATAVVSLLLLLAAVLGASAGAGRGVASITQSGLAGMGLFLITWLAGELAARLARETQAARGSLKLARQQAQLNRLVIDEMSEGVLVIDRRARVRAANPAARALLAPVGMVGVAPFLLDASPAWSSLLQTLLRAFELGHWPDDAREIALDFPEAVRTLQVRARFTRRAGAMSGDEPVEEFCVLFLEDLRAVHARVRPEKLAAMGRVSAGVAHEIRNPLAAISQANALMMEDPLDPAQQRLAAIVADNVERLKRIVDDVMEVAPGAAPQPQQIDLVATVGVICSEWAHTVQLPLGADSRLRVELPLQPLGALFDPEHLRRVLVNLLDNARRHAGPEPGAVVLRLQLLGDAQLELAVASDGDVIPAEIERHLFEPFFSTRSRGTGLGLYICRELCERYGAAIDYRRGAPGARHRNEFHIRMPRVPLHLADHRLHL